MSWTVEHRGPVAVVTFVRPPENLLSFVLLDALDEVLVALAGDRSVSVIVLTGGVAGYFVGHADLGDVDRLVFDGANADGSGALAPGAGSPDAWHTTLERISQIPQPVVAAVNGQAWGGGAELALACQLRVAASSASFCFVEVGAGAIPGAGGTQRLPRLIGPSRALRMILAGDLVSGADAVRSGLVDAVVPDDDFIARVLEWLAPISRQPRHSLVAGKRAIVGGLRLALADGLAHEQALFRAVLRSPETRAMHASPG